MVSSKLRSRNMAGKNKCRYKSLTDYLFAASMQGVWSPGTLGEGWPLPAGGCSSQDGEGLRPVPARSTAAAAGQQSAGRDSGTARCVKIKNRVEGRETTGKQAGR
jgi:hypothetical protein